MSGSSRRATVEWAAVAIVLLIVIGLVFAFGGGSGGGAGPHRRAPIAGHGG